MKKVLLIISLGLFLGAASVSAETITSHKSVKTEQKAEKPATHKGTHKKAHKKGMKKSASKSKTPKKETGKK